ncbi:MAG: signal recognition particle-docking protein FtsY [Candidatus Micrarchaeota archaeon]|nr:signal recognition particle-docking protein FtsY [Candidatus Micrarchaeota archaeon]
MFEGLKKKFSDLVGSIVKKEETKVSEGEKQTPSPEIPKERELEIAAPKEVDRKFEPVVEQESLPLPIKEVKKERLEPVVEKENLPLPEKTEKKAEMKKEQIKQIIKEPVIAPVQMQRPAEVKEERKTILTEKPKFSVVSQIKSFVLGKVTIKEHDVDELLEGFKLSLVETDVNYEVAEKLVDSIKAKLIGATVETKGITPYINKVVRDSLYEILDKGSSQDLIKMALEKKAAGQTPFRILFIGPNGAGKTTTMAKIANLVLSNNMNCVLSASDTFRAAAIEQTVHHAEKLGIKAIKGTYGADPASVAFDAIEYAKAHRIDVVLIDSAGRQDTNKSLMDEMRKMVRVTAPDLKIFIGESTTGSAIMDQVREFDNAIKLDGIILTKLDCDAKGGNTISILGSSPVPILYFGLGEKYTDMMRYSPEFIIGNIIPTAG